MKRRILLITLCSAVVLAGLGLGVFFLTKQSNSADPVTTEVAFEAVVERQTSSRRLEICASDPAYPQSLIVATENLQPPTLPRGTRILITISATEDVTDGKIETPLKLQVLEMPLSLEGEIAAIEDGYLQLPHHNDPALFYYAKLQNCDFQPEPGDLVQIYYFPGENASQLEDVREIQLIRYADFGVRLQVSDVTSTGLQLQIRIESDYPRELTRLHGITLSEGVGAGQRSVRKLPGGKFPVHRHTLINGEVISIDWTSVYGSLTPGQYTLQQDIFYQDRQITYTVDFEIPEPEMNDLDTVLNALIRYLGSKQLTNPSQTLELINQYDHPLLVSGPIGFLPEDKTYQHTVSSYEVLSHDRQGSLHHLSIAVLCQGYNNQQLINTAAFPMRLVLRQNQDGTFTATSCRIPTASQWETDIQEVFSPEIARQLSENSALWDSLESSCRQQIAATQS